MAASGECHFWVYGIYIGSRIIYVGYSCEPIRRIREHFRKARRLPANTNSYVYYYMHMAMQGGVIPRFKILAVSYGTNLEGDYIERHRAETFNYCPQSSKPLVQGTMPMINCDASYDAYNNIRVNIRKQMSYFNNLKMDITVKQLADKRKIKKVYILRLLRENKAHLLAEMGVKSWQKVGSQYQLKMQKDFILDEMP